MRKTKIVCTLGPASTDVKIIKELIRSGMDCARFNMSHGSFKEHEARINNFKRARREVGIPVPILIDTKGPEIRVGDFENSSVILNKGDIFTFDLVNNEKGNQKRVAITYRDLYKYVKKGTRILVDDGSIELRVVYVDSEKIDTRVIIGGKLANKKSMNIPSAKIAMPYISDQDKKDIAFAVSLDIDYVAASFTRSKDDVMELRAYLDTLGATDVKIISKIENPQGLRKINEILEASDGVMVARGDLGVEIPMQDLPYAQKDIIRKAVESGKIVITATQMLESMTYQARPTRAEVSDVANAVYDGTTCIMLSAETAAGMYPVKAVKAMAKIAEAAEKTHLYNQNFNLLGRFKKNVVSTTCLAACEAAGFLKAKAIVSITRTGSTAQTLADFRPNCPILALTVSEKSQKQLMLKYGVMAIKRSMQDSFEEFTETAKNEVLAHKLAKVGDTIVVVMGSSLTIGQPTDTMRIITL